MQTLGFAGPMRTSSPTQSTVQQQASSLIEPPNRKLATSTIQAANQHVRRPNLCLPISGVSVHHVSLALSTGTLPPNPVQDHLHQILFVS
uniref:Uncharacterized protein n=1 Tax=Setaria italica TaxID=4555 RepID=K3ZB84_SETIT